MERMVVALLVHHSPNTPRLFQRTDSAHTVGSPTCHHVFPVSLSEHFALLDTSGAVLDMQLNAPIIETVPVVPTSGV